MCKFKFKPRSVNFLKEVSKTREIVPRPKEVPLQAIRRGLYLVRRQGENQVYMCDGIGGWYALYPADEVRTIREFGQIVNFPKEIWEGMSKCYWLLQPYWRTQYWAYTQEQQQQAFRKAGRKWDLRIKKRDAGLFGRLGAAIQNMSSFGFKTSK